MGKAAYRGRHAVIGLLFVSTFFACQSSSKSTRDPANTEDSGRAEIEKIAFGDLPKVHTDALIIIKDGKIRYEKYARGYTADSKHLSWSMGKSIAGLIAAQAIEMRKFALTDSLRHWIPEYQGSANLLDVFQMSSGIAYKEEYSGIPVNSDATKMLYLEGVKSGFAGYTASLPLRSGVKAGDHFYYSSGDANLIMEVMKRGIADRVKHDAFPWTSFFDRMEMPNATFEQDSKGTFAGSSYVYITPTEYARLGQLLANKGRWKSEQIIPTWYFDLLSEVTPGVMKNALPGTSQTRAYSMQTTTNRPITGRGLPSEYADLPEDSLLMIGHQGQLVIASPSENLVIVRLATDEGDPFNPHRPALFSAIRKFLAEELNLKIKPAGDAVAKKIEPPKSEKDGASFKEYLKVPRLMRALYAKELCSCRFVEGRSQKQCKEDLKYSLPVLPFSSVNTKKKTVTTTFVGAVTSKAEYRGERLGCTLTK